MPECVHDQHEAAIQAFDVQMTAKNIFARDKQTQRLAKANKARVAIADERANRAWEMLLDNKGPITIAKELGVGVQQVHKYLNDRHEQLLAGIHEKATLVRDRQNWQFDQLLERWMPLALHEGLNVEGTKIKNNGELETINLETWDAGTKAMGMVLKAMDQKARINGLYQVPGNQGNDKATSARDLSLVIIGMLREVATGKPKQAEVVENLRIEG